jgi:hypothetical protein
LTGLLTITSKQENGAINLPRWLTIAASQIHGDFKDGVNAGDDYWYDGNGNLVGDNNKNITAISYNHLNLPINCH